MQVLKSDKLAAFFAANAAQDVGDHCDHVLSVDDRNPIETVQGILGTVATAAILARTAGRSLDQMVLFYYDDGDHTFFVIGVDEDDAIRRLQARVKHATT
jgi:hypothetical protein